MKQDCMESAGVRLVQGITAQTGVVEEEVCAALDWVETAMTMSRFNMYHQRGDALSHIRLAVSVPNADVPFSLRAHGFKALPGKYQIDSMLVAIRALLATPDLLGQHIDSLPMM